MEKFEQMQANNESVIRNAQALDIINYLREKKVAGIKVEINRTQSNIEVSMQNNLSDGFLALSDIRAQTELAKFLELTNAEVTHDGEGGADKPHVRRKINGEYFDILNMDNVF